jgi:MFS family permease
MPASSIPQTWYACLVTLPYLGITGSRYYLPAILADPIAQGFGLSRTTVFGLFSGALLLSAVLGPSVGRAIDNRGGRGVLALSNLVLATGLVLLGVAQGFSTLALAWAVLGVGMAMGLFPLSPPSPVSTAARRADRSPALP